ncbi:MAG: transporter [Treponema sp.]|nr:transporter [Treponema sp.]
MKLLSKTLAAGAVLAFAVMGSAFAEGELKFENEVSTDTWLIGDTFDEDHHSGQIEERMQAEYKSDKVDVNANFSVWIGSESEDVAGDKKIRARFGGWSSNDSYIKFRPIDVLQLALATSDGREFAAGSYFPVMDYKIVLGNYTGNFGLLVKPVEGLSIGAGIDYGLIFDDIVDNSRKLDLNFGAEYEVENIGAFAVTFNDVINNFSIGAYAKISAVQDMDIYAGFSYAKERLTMIQTILFENYYWYYDRSLLGKMLLNAGFEYKGIDKLTLAADLGTNLFTEANWTYDLYTGLKVMYDVNESFSVGAKSYFFFDITDDVSNEYHDYRYKPVVFLYPEANYKLGNNTFSAGFKMEFNDGNFRGAIPLSWKYSF